MTTNKQAFLVDEHKKSRWQNYQNFSSFVDTLLDNDAIQDHFNHIQEHFSYKFELCTIEQTEKNIRSEEELKRCEMFPPRFVHRQIYAAFKIPHENYGDDLLTDSDRATFEAFNLEVPIDIFFEEEGDHFKIWRGFTDLKKLVGDYMCVDLSNSSTMDFKDLAPSEHRFLKARSFRSLATALYKSIKRAAYCSMHLAAQYAMRSVTLQNKNSRNDYIKECIKKAHSPSMDDLLTDSDRATFPKVENYQDGLRFQAFKHIEVKVYDQHNEWSEERTRVELRLDTRAEDLQEVLEVLKKLGKLNYYLDR